MLILGIETSCDDTSIAVLSATRAGGSANSDGGKAEGEQFEVLSNVVSSQVKIHSEFGGVVPLLAAREHERNLPLVLQEAFKVSGLKFKDIDLVAVTSGPGLIMSLVKGVNFAKELAKQNNKPIIGVNHISGHIYSNWLDGKTPEFPALCLIVSGGHTELVLMHDHPTSLKLRGTGGKYELVGRTVDDASGEAFDKIARMLGLPYPGGPKISREAEKFKASEANAANEAISLPRPMLHSKDLNFSFSGLKTSVLYYIRDLKVPLESVRAEIAHEAQEAIVDVLISKTKKAIELHQPKSILLAGGVSANTLLREKFQALSFKLKIAAFIPPMQYTTDNAAMIALAGYYEAKSYKLKAISFPKFEANANWEIA